MPAARLARLRRRARRVLAIEAVAIAAMLPACVIAVFLIVGLAGFGGWKADLAGLIALAFALRHAIRRYRPPAPEAADRRIERDSRLPHRPLAALGDEPALAGAMPLWDAHRARLDRSLATARVGLPRPDFAAHDPFALRFLLLLGLIAAWIAAGSQAGPRLAASVDFTSPFARPGLGVQAWITPPRWAGTTPRLIGAGTGKVRALAGSTLSVVVTGAGSAAPAARIAGKALDFTNIATGSFRARLRLDHTATLTIGPFWNRIARYRITVIEPTPPRIGFAAAPGPAGDGQHVALAWRGTSRYGLTALGLDMAPVDAPGAVPDHAALPAPPAHLASFAGSARLDLLASPLAGMMVDGTLAAVNRDGQTGTSSPARFQLPAPALHNQVARAIEVLRHDLALGTPGRTVLAARLRALAAAPPGPLTPGTRKALARFAASFGPATPDYAQAQASLWMLVQRAELGATYKAVQKFDEAAQALRQALKRGLAGHPADRQTIERLISRLDRAMQARQAAHGTPDARAAARRSAIDRLAHRIENELAAGETARARQDLAKLRQMLDRMQNPSARSESQAAQRQQEAARHLASIMRQEARLMDQTAQQETMPRFGNQAAIPESSPSAGLAGRQDALRRQLSSAARAMAGAGLPGQAQLGHGQQAMGSAGNALRAGDMRAGLSGERAAIAALQQAQNALATMPGKAAMPGGGPSGLGQHAAGGAGEFGNQNDSTVSIGKAGAHSDARRIQGELIRRDAAPGLPPEAHRYYGRLLGGE
jgi:hypothetical protein